MDITSFENSLVQNIKPEIEIKEEELDDTDEISNTIFVQDSLVLPEELLICPEIPSKLDVKEEGAQDDDFSVAKFSSGSVHDDYNPQVSSGSVSDVGREKKSSPRKSTRRRNRIKKDGNSKRFTCRFCNLTFETRSKLKGHYSVHDEKKFKCSICEYKCNRKILLTVHELNHNNIKLLKCSSCPFECNRKESLKRHMLTHANMKRFKCMECSYECNQKENLKRHMLTHVDVKLFKCPNCDYGSNRKEALTTHMLSHSNIKLFRCLECDYECNNTAYLKRHMLRHSTIKLFKCSECRYECNQKVHLTTHMKRHMKKK